MLLNFQKTQREGAQLPTKIPDSYRWTTLEVFCDGHLAYQQTRFGVHVDAKVPRNYCPKELIFAFDGQPVFAIANSRVKLNRLRKNIKEYSPV